MNKEEYINQQIEKINADAEKPFVTATFGDHWKEHAKKNYDPNVVIEIAWKQGRRAILLERKLKTLILPWFSASQFPDGENPNRLVLVRRTSDEILMGRHTIGGWIVYFTDVRGMQTDKAQELVHDPIVEWQELPQVR